MTDNATSCIRCYATISAALPRGMANRGVHERVAMKITGHRIRTVFDHYHIVSPADLQEAARKLTGAPPGTPTQNEKEAAFATS